MRLAALVLISAPLFAQTGRIRLAEALPGAAQVAPESDSSSAQPIALPRIALIEFYGRRSVPESRLLAAMDLKPGDPLPSSREDLEEKLIAINGVAAASSEATCCLNGQAVLYVGIEERGAPHLDYHSPPSGEAAEALTLPDAIHREYEGFIAAVALAVRAGNTAEDLTAGYSMMSHTGARVHQIRFVTLAEEHFAELRKVVRGAADNEQRAMAAYLLGYGPDKAAAADDLQWAIRDPDPTVRNNAMRALAALAVYAARQPAPAPPARAFRVPATWFIEALNSLDWQDRITAANILVTLTEPRETAIFDQIRERSLPALVEMAQWKTLERALPAFIILGRMAGLPEKEIEDAWSAGKRDEVLAKVTGKKK